jgi:hypothetical protein
LVKGAGLSFPNPQEEIDAITIRETPTKVVSAQAGTIASGINSAGLIVGFYVDANNIEHGFVAVPPGYPKPFPTVAQTTNQPSTAVESANGLGNTDLGDTTTTSDGSVMSVHAPVLPGGVAVRTDQWVSTFVISPPVSSSSGKPDVPARDHAPPASKASAGTGAPDLLFSLPLSWSNHAIYR